MIFPDQSHINRVREALWQRPVGFASVMIGSGFSRNARKAGPDAREFPLWKDVAQALCKKLYPPSDSERLKSALSEASGTSGFLRMTQEYETAFGRGALHSFIQELVPDEDYIPDNLHIRLLRLPWRDIFTTNWDTLLERTRSFVADRAYGVVRTHNEIASAPRPRIVKLHGSFPAHTPFILTEEDYRTYPNRFAPFVNTVQQSIMETVFCLIGFSGDDPNFLSWSGWVRDNLRESAPKIYLAGWLDLSPHRRRMLEDRNVVPIDVANHPQADKWPEHLRHRYANEWIIHTLEYGQPYEITNWPSPPDLPRLPVPSILQPVEDVTIDAPVDEYTLKFDPLDKELLTKKIQDILRIWEHNRKIYPGWVFLPPNKHRLLSRSLDECEPAVLKACPSLSTLERLSALRELVWRHEILLHPLSEQLVKAIQITLDEIDCQNRKIGGVENQVASWATLRESWRDLALALLTTARQSFNQSEFDLAISRLDPFLDDHPDVVQRIHHEKCLRALYDFDFPKLMVLLKDWDPGNYDSAWFTRKSAILVETGCPDEAIRLLNRGLSIVRENPRIGRTLAGPSREGWALWLALAFERSWLQTTVEEVNGPSAFRRWQELAPLECDAFSQKRIFLDELQETPQKKDSPLFDLGAQHGNTIHFSNAEYNRWLAAQKAVRLCEVAGLPPQAACMNLSADIIAIAADLLVDTNQLLAFRLALRLATIETDETLCRVWSRYRIAALPSDEVIKLVNMVENGVKYALPKATTSSSSSRFWVTRLRVFMEALSRLVLRLSPARAEEIFKSSLGYYRLSGVAKHPWLAQVIANLLSRSWEALPKASRINLTLEILSSPIAELDGFEISGSHYPDPGGLLDNLECNLPNRSQITEGKWSEIIHLIIRGLTSSITSRERAASRLVPIVFAGRLADHERSLVAKALWYTNFTDSNSVPNSTNLFDWVFLLLPEPEEHLAEKRFRHSWLGTHDFKTPNDFNRYFWHLGTAFFNFEKYKIPFTISSAESTNVITVIEKWIQLPAAADSDPFQFNRFNTHEGIVGLQLVLQFIELPVSVAVALASKVIALNQTNTPAFRLFGSLAKFLPDQLSEFSMAMRVGLSSDNMTIAEEAVLGLRSWLTIASADSQCSYQPPGDLLEEVGIIIASRRQGVLIRALQVALWVFKEGSTEQREKMAPAVIHGLRYMTEELRYDRNSKDMEKVDIPLLRWGCAHVAIAMSASGMVLDPAVAYWVEVAKSDPLPEVRHAEFPESNRKSEGGVESKV